jgi:DNA-binding HxlR family transcriptional regulator
MSSISALFHHRWSTPILAELHRSRGTRFVVLAHRLGLSRESLSRTLTALIKAGLVQRNPGYGHPLRPEYVLTETGAKVAPVCSRLISALGQLELYELGLKKWSMPVVLALGGGSPRRFSELLAVLPDSTGRALSFALKDLVKAGLVERIVTDDFPPGTAYRLTPRAGPLASIVRRLDTAIGRGRRPRRAAPRRGGTTASP